MKTGLGRHIVKSRNGQDVLSHNGGTGNYSSLMVDNVKDKTAVIILSNVSGYNSDKENIDELSFELINEIEEK